ncbi:GNAT family N-acetyltransferase [Stenotrophomonas sp. 24(2023)]|uniref:GNAT family N-acetyltransferase n=1 Tax=Stenotrophomonas sp. 24(2023) TaxID=3068324 RepID=UPI0027DF0AD9|nr:GNAT family N-acetyltransferase [Stenotrophomonas sp. 24(2023)]WMJ69450.1 GNAT family N-acetyltransferase [Stenotrophomonas sp. 24(2023)]
MYSIRPIQPADHAAAAQVCRTAFTASIAPTLGTQGITTFHGIATADAFATRLQQDNAAWVAEQTGQLVGVIELRAGTHLAMLFVEPALQGLGIGRALLQALLPSVRSDTLTVSASLTSVDAYLRYGFTRAGDIAESHGLVYQPMLLSMTGPRTAAP